MGLADWFEGTKVVGSVLALGVVVMWIAGWMLEQEDKR